MEKADISPGYIGNSQSEKSINAIIWAGGEDFYFFVVTPWEAPLLDRWLTEGKTPSLLMEILPNLSDTEINLFLYGE